MKIGQEEKFSICRVEWERRNRRCGKLPQRMSLAKFMDCLKDEGIIYKTIIHGTEVVKLTKKGTDWAELWTAEYNTIRGHHGCIAPRSIE